MPVHTPGRPYWTLPTANPKALKGTAALRPSPETAPGADGPMLQTTASTSTETHTSEQAKAKPQLARTWRCGLVEHLREDEFTVERLTIYRLCCHNQECHVRVYQ